MNLESQYPPRWRFKAILLACLAVSLVCVVYPIYVIRPFRAQGARELAVALAVSRFGPVITAVSALVAVGAAIGYWRAQARNLARGVGSAVWRSVGVRPRGARARECVRADVPPGRPSGVRGGRVTYKLDKDDKLIAVKIGGSARAYPIRTMGYHHIVNDVVGGTAIVATY